MTRKPRSAARRLLVASHSHPAITRGGGEIASFRLHEAFTRQPGWSSWFLAGARDGSNRPGSHFAQPFDDRQYVFDARGFDWFKFANQDRTFPREFTGVLRDLAPDIVHFHQYVVLGMEAFLHVKRTLPAARMVLTLHEFLAICNNHGQMVKRSGGGLCLEASPADCVRCYPEFSRPDFFLRKAYISGFLDLVDHFIAPSRFLADRYAAWGVPEERLSVVENIIPPAAAPAEQPKHGRPQLRIGFFGQISELKGIFVMLDAAELLEEAGEAAIQFEIHGDYSNQPEHFREPVKERLAKVGHNVRYHGPYPHDRVDALMRQVDAVLVPSTWWENSPLVIQEALRNRRPVICSDIGGMAEKVRDGLDGFHFAVGSAPALAALLRDLARDRPRLDKVAATLRPPQPMDVVARQHAALYERLLAEPPRVAAA
jgi:glycosyltransferase involved in cell wall biosynthesis